MPANLENSAVATRLENISFHSNPKESQCQRAGVQAPQDPGEPKGETVSVNDLERDKERML